MPPNINENTNRITLTGDTLVAKTYLTGETLAAEENCWGTYKITKKCRYKVVFPPEEREDPIWCPNATAVSAVLQEYGRSYTTQDVYNYFSTRRCLANKSERRLKGATLIKM